MSCAKSKMTTSKNSSSTANEETLPKFPSKSTNIYKRLVLDMTDWFRSSATSKLSPTNFLGEYPKYRSYEFESFRSKFYAIRKELQIPTRDEDGNQGKKYHINNFLCIYLYKVFYIFRLLFDWLLLLLKLLLKIIAKFLAQEIYQHNPELHLISSCMISTSLSASTKLICLK